MRRESSRLTRRLASLKKRLAGQSAIVQLQMRAEVYMTKKLHLAAYLEARKAFRKSNQASQAIAIMQNALLRMDLEGTALWDEVERAAANAPPCPQGRGGRPKRP